MDYFYKYKVYKHKYKNKKGGNKLLDIPNYIKKLEDILIRNGYIVRTLNIHIPQLLNFFEKLLTFYNLLIQNNYHIPKVDISNEVKDIKENIDGENIDGENIEDTYKEILDRVKVHTKPGVGEDDDDFARRMYRIQHQSGGGDKEIREYVQYFKKNLYLYRKYIAILLLFLVLNTEDMERVTDISLEDFISSMIFLGKTVHQVVTTDIVPKVKDYIVPVVTGVGTVYKAKKKYWDDETPPKIDPTSINNKKGDIDSDISSNIDSDIGSDISSNIDSDISSNISSNIDNDRFRRGSM